MRRLEAKVACSALRPLEVLPMPEGYHGITQAPRSLLPSPQEEVMSLLRRDIVLRTSASLARPEALRPPRATQLLAARAETRALEAEVEALEARLRGDVIPVNVN